MVLLMKKELLENVLGQEAVARFEGHGCMDFTQSDSSRMVATMKSIIHTFSNAVDQDIDPFASKSFESLVLETLSFCLENSHDNHRSVSASVRKLAVRDALSYVYSCHQPVTAFELAAAVGVSQRTLEYAFQDQFGVTPAVYLRLHRLNAAHRELSESDPGIATVTQIALSWGFSHPGRFSQAHQKLFGETPSSILQGSGR